MNAKTSTLQGRPEALYISPFVEVMKLEEQDMLCGSIPDGTESYNLDNWL